VTDACSGPQTLRRGLNQYDQRIRAAALLPATWKRSERCASVTNPSVNALPTTIRTHRMELLYPCSNGVHHASPDKGRLKQLGSPDGLLSKS